MDSRTETEPRRRKLVPEMEGFSARKYAPSDFSDAAATGIVAALLTALLAVLVVAEHSRDASALAP